MLKQFFPFYGSKWRDAKRYTSPDGIVIEPFAGSAGYSTFHEPAQVLLCDADPFIVGVWQYLIGARAEEILALPDLEAGQTVDDLSVAQEARWLIGYWLNPGSSMPKKRAGTYKSTPGSQLEWGARVRERIAGQVDRIRHWKIQFGSYDTLPQIEATWFVDPPYVVKGKYYRVKKIDYAALGTWCRGLPGRVIVCEQSGATWLPFQPLATVKSARGTSAEVVWLGL